MIAQISTKNPFQKVGYGDFGVVIFFFEALISSYSTQMDNISNFLDAAESLGVQRYQLFRTVDLYEGKDMVQVR